MRTMFFPKLAWGGITKNRKLYLPYILSGMGMVMMYYIMQSLAFSPLLGAMSGGSDIGAVLSLGRFVIAAFALLFLFYTNAFLVRRRYKEFGLYNVLGMDKRGISRIMAWESLIIAAIDMAGGLLLGILFSKFAELGLLRAVRREVDYRFTVSPGAVGYTMGVFLIIFAILFLRSLWQVRRTRPLELMRSEQTGEKPPKANWFLALIGVILLGVAYYFSVTIKSPLATLLLFFVAVIMVIVATYLLFISGSVTLCRLLQKNKKYYYRKNHFVSVSSMAYRMKRNGAGLASICILCTMVLVMIASTGSLYFGADDSMQARYPRNNEITVDVFTIDNLTDEKIAQIRAGYEQVFAEKGVAGDDLLEYRFAQISGILKGDTVDPEADESAFLLSADDLVTCYFVNLADYNRMMGTEYTLSPGEAMLFTVRQEYRKDSLTLGNMTLRIVKRLDRYIPIANANVSAFPSLMLVIPDYETIRPLDALRYDGNERLLSSQYCYSYDIHTDDETAFAVYTAQREGASKHDFLVKTGFSITGGCLAKEKDDFFTTFGGLFFLGIMLSVVFIFAAAIIIYYKQVSEGYEDQARFAIMQKVGMTAEDIKQSIRSQILTVFFAPLLMAGMHLVFAFPFIWKILQLFNLHNLGLVIVVTAISFLVFGVFYAILYKVTAKAYFTIVSSDKDA